MKTLTIILIILFAAVSIFFGIILIKKMTGQNEAVAGADTYETISEATAAQSTEAETATTGTTEQATTEETFAETDENVRQIEIYLDGEKEKGIFLGDAQYDLPSDDARLLYGDDFANFGFYLKFDSSDYVFEPGSTHTLYIYTYIPAYGWEYTKQEITVPGDFNLSKTIKMSVDSLSDGEVLTPETSKDVRLSGWAADLSITDSPGISSIEVYMDGPRDFGQKLGDAQMGLERTDVGDAFGNANYNNSGYSFSFDASSLAPGSSHKVYIYAFSKTGLYQYLTREIIIQGEAASLNTLLKADAKFSPDSLEITGWAFNQKFITSGVPRALDTQYSLKKIVFVSNQSGNEDIWSMNLDGSELTQLTNDAGRDQYPSVSPDGKKIAYSADIGGNWQIVVMNWDGTNKRQITFGPNRHGFPTWSFDGRFIVFEMYIDDNWEIYIMNSDGKNIKRLTTNPGIDDWHPAAHPFEYKTLYEGGVVGSEEVWQIDFDGADKTRISKPGMRYRVPKYSIDAERIVFQGYDGNGKSQVYIMDKNGDNITQLTDAPEGAGLPIFSPDNKYIIYNSRIGGNEQIIIMGADGSGKTQLTNFAGDDWGAVLIYQFTE